MARIIWDRKGNPTDYVSRRLGIARWRLRAAIHKLKASRNLAPDEAIIVYDNGDVSDRGGELIGNIHDEI